MLVVSAIVASGGCRPKTPNTGPIEYVGATDPHPGVPVDAPVKTERCGEGDRAVAELAELRAEVKTSPAGVLMRLGLTVDDLEPVARELYFKWREVHPEPPRRAPAPPPTPAPPPVVMLPPSPTMADEYKPWWCFESVGVTLGDCSLTRSECERTLARVLNVTPGACPPLLTQQQCLDTAIDVAAQVQGFHRCARQERVSCFATYSILQQASDLVCTPTVAACKSRRAYALQHQADDIKVKSDCQAHD
ncbi:MAG: hypothetical protein E6J91_50170 [Deltaproteobacteria bacterium]|nr:MAG: hypothetical protein E6J91_50170 [Deltaproteobacteria bacterium]